MPSGHRFSIHLVRLRCYVVAIQDSPRCKQDHELKTLRVNELEATAKVSSDAPLTDDKKAGRAKSDASRTPSPPLDTGSVACLQMSSVKSIFSTILRVSRMTPSYSDNMALL